MIRYYEKLSDYEKHNRNIGRISCVDRRTKAGKSEVRGHKRFRLGLTIILSVGTFIYSLIQGESFWSAVWIGLAILMIGGFITAITR